MSFSQSQEDREAQERIKARAGRSMDLLSQELGRVPAAVAAHERGEEVRGRLGTLFPQRDK